MPADTSTPFAGHYPDRVAIEAYGNGGFRFGGMSHRGSLLCLLDGIWAWAPARAEDIDATALANVLPRLAAPAFLLLGTGRRQVFPSLGIRREFEKNNVGLEVMDTGAAARTYNVLLAERRPVCAALLAVE